LGKIFDIAEICLNGHVSNSTVKQYPHLCKSFCEECGAKTIQQCSSCSAHIRGETVGNDWYSGYEWYIPPRHCIFCGEAFPWIKDKIEALKELALELDDLNEDEKKLLSVSIEDLAKDTAKTEVFAIRFKKVFVKTKSEVKAIMAQILPDILSEAAKRILFP
jgi:hypothetical protein